WARPVQYHTEGTDCCMSLKSKLEAVIYAAEEPVTLAQLATLFGAEALDLKSAQEAAAVQNPTADSAAVVDPSQPIVSEGHYIDLRTEDGTLLEQPGFAVLPAHENAPEATSGEAAEARPDNQIIENAEEIPSQIPEPEPAT